MTSHILISVILCGLTCETTTLKVWDGDTFRTTFPSQSIRISGIDAPEIKGKCGYERYMAQTAKYRLVKLLQSGEVRIHYEGIDRYGRSLASVTVDGKDVGENLVADGLARVWSGRRESWCR
jgi:endonuclease YncB( thermonuclease family)